ncbi:MAG: S49 family peptidase [Burkholderiales bacterium]|nr:S49 family peptidase [Burkholderiales bacterium]
MTADDPTPSPSSAQTPSEFPSTATAAPATPRPGWDVALERLAQDMLKDRRSERRWRIVKRVTWILSLLLVAIFALGSSGRVAAPSGPHTALVDLRGEISSDTEASAETLIAGMKAAFKDSAAMAVVLRINSPGGSPVQAGIVHDEIRRLKALHGKKVYVVIEEACASGAYYIAVAADEIYADKASLVGSIGVLMDGFGFTGTMQKLGVERRLMTAGENKALGDPFSPLSPKHRTHVQAMLDQIHQQFISVVKQGRGERLKQTPETFSGLFWNGEKAVELGLVDKLGSLDFVAREVIHAAEVVDYTVKENMVERLAKRFGASIGAGAVKALRSIGGIR